MMRFERKNNSGGGDRIEHKTFGFEIKAAEGDGSTGEGIVSAFYNIDTYGDIVDDTFFDDDLAGGDNCRLLTDGFMGGMNHDWDNPIGVFTKAAKVPAGLNVGWKISDTAHGRDVKTLLKDKVVKKLSIGFSTLGRTWLETPDDVMAYWQTKGYTPSGQDLSRSINGARLLTKGRTYEGSPVVVPANDRAAITSVKGVPVEMTERDFERLLRDAGFSRKNAVAITAAGFKALQRDADGESDSERSGGKPGASADTSSTTDTDTLRLRTQSRELRSRLRATGVLV